MPAYFTGLIFLLMTKCLKFNKIKVTNRCFHPLNVSRFGPLPERVLALYTHQILEGVAYLHMNRVIHRDLKGNNVMLMPTGVIKLIDFGCARRLSCFNSTACNSELLKSVHGTPYWMAPEVNQNFSIVQVFHWF